MPANYIAGALCIWQVLPGNNRPALQNKSGWVLMDKKNAQQTYTRFKPVIDSLLAGGFELHDFNAGFKKEALQEALEPVTDTSLVKPASYWNLIAILNEQVSGTLLHCTCSRGAKHGKFQGRSS